MSTKDWQWLSDQPDQVQSTRSDMKCLDRRDHVTSTRSDRELHIALGMIPRRLGRDGLCPGADELDVCQRIRPGWQPVRWTIAGAARVWLLCGIADREPEGFGKLFTALCRTAELSESLALYQGTVLFPFSDGLDRQIGEGLRTNMRAVFEAIAHHNPYPCTHFDEHRWNHLLLKALFIDSRLAPIQGLDGRRNRRLATTLCEYAHERWAAGREVSHELWRCVGPFASGTMIDDLWRVSESESAPARGAAALALSECPDPAAADILARMPAQVAAIADGELTWSALTDPDPWAPELTRP